MNFFHNSLKRKLVQQHTKKKIVNMAQLWVYISACRGSIDKPIRHDNTAARGSIYKPIRYDNISNSI